MWEMSQTGVREPEISLPSAPSGLPTQTCGAGQAEAKVSLECQIRASSSFGGEEWGSIAAHWQRRLPLPRALRCSRGRLLMMTPERCAPPTPLHTLVDRGEINTMAAKVLLVTLLAAAACLSAAQIPKEAPYSA